MADKKRPSRSISVFKMLLLVPNIIQLLCSLTTLLKIEARLAAKSLISIVVFAIVFGCLLISTWFGLLALFFVYLAQINFTPPTIILIILGLNILLLIIVGIVITKIKKRLVFEATREQCHKISKYF